MNVLIVSSHMLIGQSLVAMLHNIANGEPMDAKLCDTAEATEHVRSWNPDLVLVEAIADFAGGIDTVREVRETNPDVRQVVLGTDADEASVYEAMCAGACGYVPRDTSANALLATLRGVLRGELGLSRTAALRLVQQLCRPAVQAGPSQVPLEVQSRLTQREQEIFELVRRGVRSREIAERLFIAEATVYKHIQNILDKLQVHSRTEAVFVAQLAENGNSTPGLPEHGKPRSNHPTPRQERRS